MAFKNQFYTCAFLMLFNVVFNDLMASSHYISTRVSSPNEWTIPFKLVKDLIVVEAFVDGKKGNFIVDTGSEFLILNSNYIKGELNPDFLTTDFGGNNTGIEETMVSFSWSNRKAKSFNSLVIDLSSLEEILGMKIMGYIGYEVLKRNEVVFDYQQKSLTLFDLDRKGNRKDLSGIHEAPSDTISLGKNSFQPYLLVSVGTEQFRLGIDSGASLNLLDKNRIKDFGSNFQAGIAQRTVGFNGKEMLVSSGVLREINIRDFIWPSMECVVKDMGYLNKTLSKRLDGLLGFEFLNQYKISINYRKNQMYIWNPEILLTNASYN